MQLALSASTPLPANLQLSERDLPDIRSEGGSYEVGSVCSDCCLVNVCYSRDTTRHSTCSRSGEHIHAQSQSTTLDYSEAYL